VEALSCVSDQREGRPSCDHCVPQHGIDALARVARAARPALGSLVRRAILGAASEPAAAPPSWRLATKAQHELGGPRAHLIGQPWPGGPPGARLPADAIERTPLSDVNSP